MYNFEYIHIRDRQDWKTFQSEHTVYSIWLLGFLKQNIDGKIWFGHSIPNESFRNHIKRMGKQKFWEAFGYFLQIRQKPLNLSVNNQLNSSSTQLIIAAHNCHKAPTVTKSQIEYTVEQCSGDNIDMPVPLAHGMCYSHCRNGVRNSSIKPPLWTPFNDS